MSEQVVTTARILEALRAEYPREKGWAVAVEVQDPASGRRADLMAVNTWDHRTEIIEVKMSRGDALNDLKNPEKSAPLRQQASAWWLACPPDVVTIPEAEERRWGVIAVQDDGSVTRFPGLRLDASPSYGLMVAFLRRVLAEDWIREVETQAYEAGLRDGKNKAAQARPAGQYTKQDLDNAHEEGFNEAKRLYRKKERKAAGGMS